MHTYIYIHTFFVLVAGVARRASSEFGRPAREDERGTRTQDPRTSSFMETGNYFTYCTYIHTYSFHTHSVHAYIIHTCCSIIFT